MAEYFYITVSQHDGGRTFDMVADTNGKLDVETIDEFCTYFYRVFRNLGREEYLTRLSNASLDDVPFILDEFVNEKIIDVKSITYGEFKIDNTYYGKNPFEYVYYTGMDINEDYEDDAEKLEAIEEYANGSYAILMDTLEDFDNIDYYDSAEDYAAKLLDERFREYALIEYMDMDDVQAYYENKGIIFESEDEDDDIESVEDFLEADLDNLPTDAIMDLIDPFDIIACYDSRSAEDLNYGLLMI